MPFRCPPRPGICRRALIQVALVGVLIGLPGGMLKAQARASEAHLKAAFLFNFGQYVQWPEEPSGSMEAPNFLICIHGEEEPELYGALEELTRNMHMQGRPVQTAFHREMDGTEFCDILYVSDSEAENFPAVLERVSGYGVLTVSEIPGFAENGGMIRLIREGNRFRFEINPGAAEADGLHLSVELLKLARIVGRVPHTDGKKRSRRPRGGHR